MMKKYLWLLLSVAIVACSSTAQNSQKEQAKAVFDQAVAIYQQKDYAQASEMGHIKANRYIGLSYLNGTGVAKDVNKAFEQFSFAAERGDVTSKYWLGYCYENGLGTPKEMTKAVYWYQQAVRNELIFAISKQSQWIADQLQFFQQNPPLVERQYISGESHRYLGRQYLLKVYETPNKPNQVRLWRGQLEVSVRKKRHDKFNNAWITGIDKKPSRFLPNV